MIKGSAHDLDALAAHVRAQRWFGAKSSAVERAELVDVIPVRWPGNDTPYAVVRARITTGRGPSLHQLFLVGEEPRLEDALQDAAFRRGLAQAFQRGATFQQGDTRWVLESVSATPLVMPANAPTTLGSAEQSNSSVLIDKEAILKLYRRLESGVHPDVEVTRFLTVDRKFVHVPVLLGVIRFEDDTGATTAGMLQELVPGATDGWSFALDVSRAFFAADGTDQPVPFEQPARQLGEVTRALHETLASGERGSAFDARPATNAHVAEWGRAARVMAERALASLARAVQDGRVSRGDRGAAEGVLEGRARYLDWIDSLTAAVSSDAGAMTRTHGDYHLGQVLRSSTNRFLVIDFEGEPARPLAERRAHQSPLRDVAGMLRSFAYAASVGSSEPGGHDEASDARAARWETASRGAFLEAYFGGAPRGSTTLPASDANRRALIALFEAEKLFYELQYELDHRPDWVWIPLRGIAKLST